MDKEKINGYTTGCPIGPQNAPIVSINSGSIPETSRQHIPAPRPRKDPSIIPRNSRNIPGTSAGHRLASSMLTSCRFGS